MPTTVEADARPEERYLSAFELHNGETLNGTTKSIGRQRQEAIKRFEALGLPTNKQEVYKYTNLARVFDRDYRISTVPETPRLERSQLEQLNLPAFDAHRVVLVNGRFSEELSDIGTLPNGVVVSGLAKASREHPELVSEHFGQHADFEEDALIALNTAFVQDGTFVYVPRGTVVEKPIYVLHVTKSDDALFIQPRNLFVAEEGAIVKIVETRHAIAQAQVLTNSVTEIFVGRQANMDHYLVQNEGMDASQATSTEVYQEGDSYFSTNTFTFSGDVVRNNLHITADDQHCESHLLGLYLGREDLHVDNRTLVDHTQPDCFSNELYKGILNDESTGVFNGKVFVHRGAQRINAYQSNKNIVLTRGAQAYSKPELEIYADDVQCSHGSTTGQLDEEAIFYLRSRGLSESKAKQMLLHAFARDVVDEVQVEALRAWLDEIVMERFAF